MGNLGAILPTVLTITTIIGIALAGLMQGVVKNLRDTLTDVRGQRDDKDREAEQYKAESKEKDALLAAKDADIAALGRVVTGEAYLTALGDKLDEHHNEARAYWTADAEISKETLDVLKRLSGGN